MEVTVVMAVMSVVMAIATAGMLQLLRVSRLTVGITDGQSQLGRIFHRLDSQVRYAADLRTQALPASSSAFPSLLYLITVGSPRCYAISMVGDRLVRQVWTPRQGVRPGEILATGVAPAPGVPPFQVTQAPGSATTSSSEEAVTQPPVTAKAAIITVTVAASLSTQFRELRATFIAPNTARGPQGTSLDDCVS